MPTSDRLIPSWVEDWFSRGILIRRLNSNDIQGETDVRKAAEALVVGLAVTGVAEFFVVSEYSPKDSFGQLLGLPAYAIVHGVAAITCADLIRALWSSSIANAFYPRNSE
jgi:hypothetical protein